MGHVQLAPVVQEALRKLPAEAKKQADHVAGTEKKLRRVRDIMKTNAVVSSRSAKEMLQSCIIPRLLMSPEDAIFCAVFFLRMHDLDMPGFSTCYAINEVPDSAQYQTCSGGWKHHALPPTSILNAAPRLMLVKGRKNHSKHLQIMRVKLRITSRAAATHFLDAGFHALDAIFVYRHRSGSFAHWDICQCHHANISTLAGKLLSSLKELR